jgi:hypothetical protein
MTLTIDLQATPTSGRSINANHGPGPDPDPPIAASLAAPAGATGRPGCARPRTVVAGDRRPRIGGDGRRPDRCCGCARLGPPRRAGTPRLGERTEWVGKDARRDRGGDDRVDDRRRLGSRLADGLDDSLLRLDLDRLPGGSDRAILGRRQPGRRCDRRCRIDRRKRR